MKLTGTIAIAAPATQVWTLVIDPIGLAGCVPGVREVVPVDDRTFDGSIVVAVGPMEGDFSFRSVITEARFPDQLRVEMNGLDSVTKSRLEAMVAAGLTETAAGTTLAYVAEIKVHGRLAILGEMVLRATASMMIAQVTRCLRTRLEADAQVEPSDAGTSVDAGKSVEAAPPVKPAPPVTAPGTPRLDGR